MSYPIGHLPASALAQVQAGIYLAKPTAARYRALQAEAKSKLHRIISIAQPAGGYRSEADQDAMHHAGSAAGTAAERARWGLNPNSTVAIASHPGGTHETGTRVDIVGTPIDAAFLALAAKYGFVREFGAADPNHFIDRGTYTVPVVKKIAAAVTSKKVVVTVLPGQTLSGIAAAHSTATKVLTVAKLLSLNPGIHDANRIKAGQKVRVA